MLLQHRVIVLLENACTASVRSCGRSVSEKEWDAPRTRKGNHGVDYTAEDGVLTAEEPRDYVKLKQSHASPIRRADYG